MDEDRSENDTEIDEYSSDTTIKGSNSTYISESDALENIEDNTNISTVNSEDFSFNIANIYHEDEQSLIESSLESDLDVPIAELANECNDSEINEGTQLFNIGISYETVLHVIFTQILAQSGIKMFGEKAVAAMFKELKQLNDGVSPGKPVIVPIPFELLCDEDKKGALEAVNLIAQKRCGRIKGKPCANGSWQCKFIKDTESFASPTASLEAIMTTLMIDTYEERDVAIADVPGAYLHAEFPKDKKVILKLSGVFVDIMCDVNPEYRQHVIYETTKKGKELNTFMLRFYARYTDV